jgi:hypothetical protein
VPSLSASSPLSYDWRDRRKSARSRIPHAADKRPSAALELGLVSGSDGALER